MSLKGIYIQLSDRYASSTTNKIMAALSRVLEEAWKLGLMSVEDYHRRRRAENWPKVTDWQGFEYWGSAGFISCLRPRQVSEG